MGRIADYVDTLSPAEREQFRDLIEECQEREDRIQHSAARAQSAVNQLNEQQRLLCLKIRELEEAGRHLMDTVSRLYLRTVPAPTKMH
jgi:predicted nuclease with TOPRIM domain